MAEGLVAIWAGLPERALSGLQGSGPNEIPEMSCPLPNVRPTPDGEIENGQGAGGVLPAQLGQRFPPASAGESQCQLFEGGIVAHEKDHGLRVGKILENGEELPGRGMVEVLSDLHLAEILQLFGNQVPCLYGPPSCGTEDPVRDKVVPGHVSTHTGRGLPSPGSQRPKWVREVGVIPAGFGVTEKQ
jgi:hypothetical protein